MIIKNVIVLILTLSNLCFAQDIRISAMITPFDYNKTYQQYLDQRRSMVSHLAKLNIPSDQIPAEIPKLKPHELNEMARKGQSAISHLKQLTTQVSYLEELGTNHRLRISTRATIYDRPRVVGSRAVKIIAPLALLGAASANASEVSDLEVDIKDTPGVRLLDDTVTPRTTIEDFGKNRIENQK